MLNPFAQAQRMQHSWTSLLLRGILAIIFSIIVFVSPGIALFAIIIVFGAYAFLDGILGIIIAIRERHVLPLWGWFLVEGITGVVLGIVAFVWPGETALILLYIVAIWAIITGIMKIGTSFTVHDWLIGLAGILSLAFGVLLIARPGAGLLFLLWLLRIYALAFGLILIADAFQLRMRSISQNRM